MTTGLVQQPMMGQTTLVQQQPMMGGTHLAAQTGYVQQPMMGGTGLAGQALQQNSMLVKEGLVQPNTGVVLGQTAPSNIHML